MCHILLQLLRSITIQNSHRALVHTILPTPLSSRVFLYSHSITAVHKLSRNMSTHSGGGPHLNRLAQAKSPYLLQHAENPVDWYEWGADAFNKAKHEKKPIFLSIGYSACHWCHVLAHESFEDPVTAKLMNEYYVNIKVDREERPDVDRLYMMFLQATSGGGGWPMSVWLTPDLHPFFAGTYFPPGQFRQILSKLADVWESSSDRCITSGKQIIEALRLASQMAPDTSALSIAPLATSVFDRLKQRFDMVHGGFGSAPKFPSPAQTMHFLARYAATHAGEPVGEVARDMAVRTMACIYNGGIRDVVGDGFARYSVDERWHVPHFEKMLYDQAQLLSSALELAQLVPPDAPERATLQRMAASIITYVARDLTSPAGGFFSAEDADSLPSHESTVKKEGAFYVWTADDIDRILGGDAPLFKFHFGVEDGGNCDPSHDAQGELKGQNVLYTAHTVEETAKQFASRAEDVERVLDTSLATLKAHRDKERPRPHLDDKILACWNGLMISGLSRAADVLDKSFGLSTKALELAEGSAAFLRANLYDEQSGELRRSFREGPGPKGQADDYAFLIQGLLDLYEASGKEEYAVWALRLQEKQDELFFDTEGGGYFVSAPDEHILVRMKDAQDGAEPSAVAVTLANLQRLAHITEDRYTEYEEKVQSVLAVNAQLLREAPFALATMVSAALAAHDGYKQFIFVGSAEPSHVSPLLQAIRRPFISNRVLIHLDPANPPRELAKVNATLRTLVADIDKKGGQVSENVRVCQNFACGLPIEDVEKLKHVLA